MLDENGLVRRLQVHGLEELCVRHANFFNLQKVGQFALSVNCLAAANRTLNLVVTSHVWQLLHNNIIVLTCCPITDWFFLHFLFMRIIVFVSVIYRLFQSP